MLLSLAPIVVIALAAIGLTLGLVLAAHRGKHELGTATARAAEILASARAQEATIREQAAQRGVSERDRNQAAAEAEMRRERGELDEYEGQLNEREQLLDGRESLLTESQQQAEQAQAGVLALERQVGVLQDEMAQHKRARLEALEKKSGQTQDEVREQLVREQVSKIELSSLMRLRQSEETLTEAAPTESRRVMQVAIERYDSGVPMERLHNTIAIEQAETYTQLADTVGRCRNLFLEEIGCELVCDDETRNITVRGEDPLAREIARRLLRQISGQRGCDVDRLRRAARDARSEIDREVQNAGRRACRQLELGRVHPDIVNLIGRLKYRLSYSQNQWRHSIEVAYLAGLLAWELGLDSAAARRGGLLHDIGKALTHEHDGSHAVLGAEVARKCGESDIIANAIGAHHNDEQPRSAIAHIVTAADALSGARPGARRESVTQYLSRIQDIQRIASRSPAVRRVDIMQAGREVRVVVAGDERGAISDEERHNGPILSDADIQPLAAEIARGIESELTFAGQIKVTVIRESRAVSVAQ